jgi:hypothetical protein
VSGRALLRPNLILEPSCPPCRYPFFHTRPIVATPPWRASQSRDDTRLLKYAPCPISASRHGLLIARLAEPTFQSQWTLRPYLNTCSTNRAIVLCVYILKSSSPPAYSLLCSSYARCLANLSTTYVDLLIHSSCIPYLCSIRKIVKYLIYLFCLF